MSLPITSTTTSKSSTTCDAEYNTVTYSMTDSNFKQLQQSGLIPNETIINSLIQQSESNTAKINTIRLYLLIIGNLKDPLLLQENIMDWAD